MVTEPMLPSSGSTPTRVGYARFPRRLFALTVDSLVYLAAFGVVLLLAFALQSSPPARVVVIGMLLLFVALYEPILVWRCGGTLGHRALNLRVVSDAPGGWLSFPRAVARTLLKLPFGAAAFIFMASTRRHQALHDLAVGSTVQVYDMNRADRVHFVYERPSEATSGLPSKRRRVAVILGYGTLSFAGFALTLDHILSELCLSKDRCSAGEELVFYIVTVAWFLLLAGILAAGWAGGLWGARRRMGVATGRTEQDRTS